MKMRSLPFFFCFLPKRGDAGRGDARFEENKKLGKRFAVLVRENLKNDHSELVNLEALLKARHRR